MRTKSKSLFLAIPYATIASLSASSRWLVANEVPSTAKLHLIGRRVLSTGTYFLVGGFNTMSYSVSEGTPSWRSSRSRDQPPAKCPHSSTYSPSSKDMSANKPRGSRANPLPSRCLWSQRRSGENENQPYKQPFIKSPFHAESPQAKTTNFDMGGGIMHRLRKNVCHATNMHRFKHFYRPPRVHGSPNYANPAKESRSQFRRESRSRTSQRRLPVNTIALC